MWCFTTDTQTSHKRVKLLFPLVKCYEQNSAFMVNMKENSVHDSSFTKIFILYN